MQTSFLCSPVRPYSCFPLRLINNRHSFVRRLTIASTTKLLKRYLHDCKLNRKQTAIDTCQVEICVRFLLTPTVAFCQAQVQVRCRSGFGQGKRKKLKDMDLSYTIAACSHPTQLYITATCSILLSKTFQPLAQQSSLKIFSHLLPPNSGMTSKWALSHLLYISSKTF